MPSSGKARKIRGATLVEITLVIPVFLAIILIILWVATMLNARASLISAMSQGIHLAISRAHPNTFGAPLLKGVSDFRTNDSSAVSAIKQVLCSDPANGECLQTYDECTILNEIYGSPARFERDGSTNPYALQDLPEEYLYALVYITDAMRQSLGNMVRYPCIPEPQSAHCPNYTGQLKGSGCFFCYFDSPLDPPTDTIALPILSTEYYTDPKTGNNYSKFGAVASTIKIRCEYEPDVSIARPLHALLRWGYPKGNIVSWETSYSVSSLAESKTFF